MSTKNLKARYSNASHIVVDARPLSGKKDGIGRFVEQLVLALQRADAGHITLISNREIKTSVPVAPNVTVLVDHPIWRKVPGTLWLILRAPTLARKLGATDLLGTQHVIPLWGMGKVRAAVILHDFVFTKFPATMTWQNRWISRIFVPKSIRAADTLLSVSRTTQNDLLRDYRPDVSKCHVLYPGCAFAPVAAATEQSDMLHANSPLRFLFVGSIEPRKNVDKLLRAFFLASKSKPCVLDIVSGSGWGDALSDDLRERIASDPGVRMHRGISDDALANLYASADALVFPSSYEGFGLPLLEAVDRCAVIANRIPVFEEIADYLDGVEFLDFGASDVDTARNLLEAVARAKRPVRFKQERFRELFDWNRTAGTLINVLRLHGHSTAITNKAGK